MFGTKVIEKYGDIDYIDTVKLWIEAHPGIGPLWL